MSSSLSSYVFTVPQRIKEYAEALQSAVPEIAKVSDGATNGQGFGAVQFMAMRSATYAALEVGAVNGQ